jgi:hypothetical protein
MNRVLIPIVLLLLVSGVGVAAFSQRPWLARSDVVQPIPFSHRIHAGVNGIPCQYCHEYARRSSASGVPPVQRCVGCHGTSRVLEAGLEPVRRPWTDETPPSFEIRWNRVYTLPDFVKFSHKPHIAASIACQTCHGPVETMDRVVPVHEINMGFCLNCHTRRGAPIDCVVCHH